MRWLKNVESIAASGKVGKCPECGSENTDYLCKIVDVENQNGYMDIWCEDCRRAFHVSRMQISKDLKTIGEKPKGLKY